MHDIKSIRRAPEEFDSQLKRRGVLDDSCCSDALLAKDRLLRETLTQLQQLQEQRNDLSKIIGVKKRQGENSDEEEKSVADIKEERVRLEKQAQKQSGALNDALSVIPNLLAAEVPEGNDESDNQLVATWGDEFIKQGAWRDHVALGEALSLMDFSRAAMMSGARFVILRGALAQLERALAAFMLSVHCEEHGYEEIAPPVLLRKQSLYGTGQLPKFSEDLYQTQDGWWLSPTAEVQLANMAADTMLPQESLPLRFTAYTQCFRSEAGAAGKDTRGMIRQHQFSKVELVSICEANQAQAEHERMTHCAEAILQKLQLPYRKILLCSGDTGFAARKTYDLEVWMAGQGCYREISSASDCGDFQARRLNCMVKSKEGKSFAHTLNASGLAVGRCLIALMEHYQQKDGSIAIPDVLQTWMNGMTHINAAS